MRTSVLAMIVGLVVAGWAAPAVSWPGGQPASRPAAAKITLAGDEEALKQRHERLIAVLKLTKEQDPVVRKLLAAYRKSLIGWLRTNASEIEKLQGQMKKFHSARDPKTKKQVRAAMARLGSLRADRRRMGVGLLAGLRKVLSQAQHIDAARMLSPQQRSGRKSRSKWHLLTELGLTRKQLDQIQALMVEAKKAANAGGRDAGGMPMMNPMTVAWRRIIREVLTDKDRERLKDRQQMASHRRMVLSSVDRLILTQQQIEAIEGLWKKAYDKAKADPKNKFNIYVQVRDEVIAKILTEEQRKGLKPQSGRKGRPGMPAGHPPMGRGRKRPPAMP